MFDGKAYGEDIVGIVKGFVEREIAPLRAENESLKARLKELEDRPAPEKGDPGENGCDGKDGANGTGVTVDDVAPVIAEQVAKAIAGIPSPKDGTDGKDGRDGTNGQDGIDGKDAAGVVQALKDQGELVLTLADGNVIRTGIRDGEKGQDGKDGRDGFSLEDFDIKRGDDQRTLIFRFEGKEYGFEYELSLQHPIYVGVYKEGQEYAPGDMVTWGGHIWHCNEASAEKPDVGPWTLAMRKARDGKDAK